VTVIIDANVLIAALIKDGIVRRILVGNPGVWLIPETTFEEVWEHRQVWNIREISDKELHRILDKFIEDYISVISEELYHDLAPSARRVVSDKDDWPLIALALSVDNEGIWTFNYKHFKKAKEKGISILNTKEISKKFKPIE